MKTGKSIVKASDKSDKKGMSLTTKIVCCLLLGIAVGIFFGEPASWLTAAGKVYVGLMQMAVLPYIVVSLIGKLGRLSRSL